MILLREHLASRRILAGEIRLDIQGGTLRESGRVVAIAPDVGRWRDFCQSSDLVLEYLHLGFLLTEQWCYWGQRPKALELILRVYRKDLRIGPL